LAITVAAAIAWAHLDPGPSSPRPTIDTRGIASEDALSVTTPTGSTEPATPPIAGAIEADAGRSKHPSAGTYVFAGTTAFVIASGALLVGQTRHHPRRPGHSSESSRRARRDNTTWPNTANPHLFINRRTAPRLVPVSRSFAWDQTGISPQALRKDRIIDEVNATGGDVKRICERFGIGVEAALRYTRTLDTDQPDVEPPTAP
jgi:hypothetical protein